MDGDAAIAAREGNIVYLSRGRAACGDRRTAAQRRHEALAEDPAQERREALATLRTLLSPGALVHAVMRFQDPECDWLVCDFYLIEGPEVTCLTREVAMAIGRYDPEREIGVKLHCRPGGGDPLRQAIEERLSLALFGETGRLRHRVIG